MEILILLSISCFATFILTAWMFCKQLVKLRNQLNGQVHSVEKLLVLRARVRAFEHLAYKVERGEAYYIVQDPYGKFRKMQLPSMGTKNHG